ncbi:hypothetical protein S231_00170 [Candidatus Phytoplasma solani]|nr:hypothetical protein S231_00170 [Candidatus Phytoplasma solani]
MLKDNGISLSISTIVKFILKVLFLMFFLLVILSYKIAFRRLKKGFFSNHYASLKSSN